MPTDDPFSTQPRGTQPRGTPSLRKRSRFLLVPVGIGLVLFFATFFIPRSRFEAPQRQGPPAVVGQEEERMVSGPGGGRASSRNLHWETRYHFELHGHDLSSSQRRWKHHLLMLRDKDGGSSAEIRILGQDGDAVWLYLHDQVIAVSSRDRNVLADRAFLEQRTPALAGMIPAELNFYAFDQGLVITAADARRFIVRAPEFAALPYTPANEEWFTRAQYMSTRWNGGYSTKDFLTRQATIDGRWIGFYSAKEAADAGEDEFGSSLENPSSVLDEGSQARRTFWSARIGKTKEFSEGRHDRLFDLTRRPGAPEYLRSGFFIRQGTTQPLLTPDASGTTGPMILHLTRIDAEGRLALTSLGPDFGERWTAVLPFSELENRWEWADRLLLVGSQQITAKGVTRTHDLITTVDLRDGAVSGWNVTLERDAATVPTP